MFGAPPVFHHGHLQASNSCAPVAVRMSGDAGTLAGRIANCTDANIRNYGNWYDVIYVGNGYGWAIDRGVYGEKVQQHLCLLKGLNVSTTERQIGSIRWDSNAGRAQSDSIYRIVSSSTVGTNQADPGNKARLKVVDNPYKPGSPCLLMRVRSLDPTSGSSYNARAAYRVFGTPYDASGSARTAPNMRYMDRMPRWREQWFACAYIFGDDASFPEGEAESWINAGGSNPEVCGWQLHSDDGSGSYISSPTSPRQDPSTPNFSLWLAPTTGGTESNCKLQIKRWRAAGPTKIDASQEFISESQTGVDGAMETSSTAKLWEAPVPFRTRWVGFVSRLIMSVGGDGLIQTWYNELDSYVSGSAPTKIIDVAGRNNDNLGRVDVGYYINASGGRQNPQHRRGDPYLCFEIYNAESSAATWTLPASVTIRSMPIRNHDRNPARTPDEYALDLMSLLKAAVY